MKENLALQVQGKPSPEVTEIDVEQTATELLGDQAQLLNKFLKTSFL